MVQCSVCRPKREKKGNFSQVCCVPPRARDPPTFPCYEHYRAEHYARMVRNAYGLFYNVREKKEKRRASIQRYNEKKQKAKEDAAMKKAKEDGATKKAKTGAATEKTKKVVARKNASKGAATEKTKKATKVIQKVRRGPADLFARFHYRRRSECIRVG